MKRLLLMIGLLTMAQPARADFGLFKFMGFIAALKYSATNFAEIMDIVNGIRAKRNIAAPQIVYINQQQQQPQYPRPAPYNPQWAHNHYASRASYSCGCRDLRNHTCNWRRPDFCHCRGNYGVCVCEPHGHYRY